MKRSTRVALTLLVPAMAAFGCGQQTSYPPTTRACDVPTVPGSPNQAPSCAAPSSGGYGSSSHISGYRSNRSGWWGSSGSSYSSGHSSWGGFGGTGSHFSGGS